MKNNTFNISALKRYNKKCKSDIVYFETATGNVILRQNPGGHFAAMVDNFTFTSEILPSVNCRKVDDVPQILKRVFAEYFPEDFDIVSPSPVLIRHTSGTTANIYINHNAKYISPINSELLNIINDLLYYTAYQTSDKAPVLFINRNNANKIVIMPMYNRFANNVLTGISEAINK